MVTNSRPSLRLGSVLPSDPSCATHLSSLPVLFSSDILAPPFSPLSVPRLPDEDDSNADQGLDEAEYNSEDEGKG